MEIKAVQAMMLPLIIERKERLRVGRRWIYRIVDEEGRPSCWFGSLDEAKRKARKQAKQGQRIDLAWIL